MTSIADTIRPRRPQVARAILLTCSAALALGAFAFAAHADDRRHDDHRRPPPRYHHGGYHGGYYPPPPPVAYGAPYYAPPPVVYGPGVGIALPGVNINIR